MARKKSQQISSARPDITRTHSDIKARQPAFNLGSVSKWRKNSEHFRFEKEAKTRRRKAPSSSGNNWNKMANNLLRSIFQFEISASSSVFGGARNSKFSAPVTTTRCESTPLGEISSCADESSERQNTRCSTLCLIQNLSKTMAAQVLGLTTEFKKNGLPWSGDQCRSILAGGSGVLFCIPAIFCNGNRIEQSIWITQAILSVLADYVYIDQDSWFHGIDRIFATSNVVAMIARAVIQLQAIILITGVFPIGAFILANRSKQQLNLEAWKFYHFLWHLTSSLKTAFVVYLLYNCPDYTQSLSSNDLIMDLYCSKSS